MSLETAADVATIIAAVIASGAILTWFLNLYYRRHPFKLKRVVYSRSKHFNGPAYFQLDVVNKLPHEIEIRSVCFMEQTIYRLSQLSGEFENIGTSRPVDNGTSYNKGARIIDAGAEDSFSFVYKKTEDADVAYSKISTVLIRTNRGYFSCKIRSITVWNTKGGIVEYSASATTKLGKHWNSLRYCWWKFCLSDEKQRKYVLQDKD